MKKFLAVIAVLAVVICGVFVLSACGDDTPREHTHVADSYEITVPATCTTTGKRTGVCKICGMTFSEVILITHDWHLQSETPPTCIESGVEIYACANCFKTDRRSVAALGHDDGVIIPAVPAGCLSGGWTEGKSCSRCGEVIVKPQWIPHLEHELYYEKRSNDTHAIYCENCTYSRIENCEFEEIEIAPTCTEAGKLIHTCGACGDSHEHSTFAALGHQMTENKTFYKTVEGAYKHRQTCYRCEYYIEEDCGGTVADTVIPTCENIGYTVYTCDGCGNTYNSDFTDALGHDWSEYVLDDNTVEPYAHTHSRHCQRDNCTAEENGVSVGTVISVRTDETCETDAFTAYSCSYPTCTYSRKQTHNGTALGHSYSSWEYNGDNDERHTHKHSCLRTGCDKQETADCRMTSSSQAATCTKPGIDIDVCQDCYHVDRDESLALGHKWSNWINVRETNGNLMHTHICTVCSLREYGAHSYETTTTPADCEHDEAIVNTCSVCSYTTSTAVRGTALGHDWKVVESAMYVHKLVCQRDLGGDAHEVTASHDYSHSNLCYYCGYDGLVYEVSVTGDYLLAKSDNGVPLASEITVPSSSRNPAYYTGSSLPEILPVRAIGSSAFARNTVIKKVILPATITAIEANAFEGCTALATVEFYGGDSQLTRIEYGAFYNCAALAEMSLPSTLKTIGNIAFSGCVSFDNIAVPDSVTEIGYRALYNTAYYNNDKNWVGGALYAGLYLIRVRNSYFTDDSAEFGIKANTLAVAEYAFDGCSGMVKVTIPVTVKTIGGDAFDGCDGLKEVVYAGSVSDWFAITFVNTLSSPMYYATSMSILGEVSSELVLPENITSIPAGTFKGNTKLVTVTIPAKVTTIGDEAFMGCINLVNVIFVDDNIRCMGKDAFLDTAFYKDSGNWEGGVLILGNHILATDDEFTATEYVIADNIRTVSAGAFAKRNIKSLTVGAGVVWLSAGAFNILALDFVTFNSTGSWFAKNAGGAVRLVSVTANASSNARLFRDYTGEWRRA